VPAASVTTNAARMSSSAFSRGSSRITNCGHSRHSWNVFLLVVYYPIPLSFHSLIIRTVLCRPSETKT
jgi:hypothetical protein